MPQRGGTDTKGPIDVVDDDESSRSLGNIVRMRTSGMKIKEDKDIEY